jgi:cell division protein FtsN
MAQQTTQKLSGRGKKTFMLQLTGRGIALWLCLIFLVCGWMFVLGVLVGRGSAPVNFDIQAIQEELIALKESMLKKEKDVIELHLEKGQAKNTLEFYEALKGKTKDDTIDMPARKEKPAQSKTADLTSNQKGDSPSAPTSKHSASKQINPQKGGTLAVQVASTKDPASANYMAAQLQNKGYPAFTMKAEIPEKGTWYRVRIGYFNSKADAESVQRQLLQEKYKGIIVRK